ncbi:unnamed protein product, partial [Closterium sp. NIES-53]
GGKWGGAEQKRYVEMPITDVLQMMGHAGRPQFDNEAKAVILVHEPKKSFYKKVRGRQRGEGGKWGGAEQKRYVEMPITDVLQMMGHAGRPQFDNEAKAVILMHEPKKSFYKKFLYEPFPVESSLHLVLHDHLNAEVAGGSIASVQDAMDYLTWTFFFRRLLCNPSFYGLSDTSAESVNVFLSDLVSRTLSDLDAAGCIALQEDGSVDPLPPGLIASQYYLHFTTAALFTANLTSPSAAAAITLETVLHVLCGAAEFDELPVRHNEEFVNAELAKHVRWKVDHRTYDDPHTKTNLLLQVNTALR